MQPIKSINTSASETCSTANCNSTVSSTRRKILKLSDMDSDLISDLSGMFGMWKEADHCDKDDY